MMSTVAVADRPRSRTPVIDKDTRCVPARPVSTEIVVHDVTAQNNVEQAPTQRL